MKIAITGASGFVGTALARLLLDGGHVVTGLGTSGSHPLQSAANFTWVSADTTLAGTWQSAVGQADAVVNLAGRTIFKRWSRIYKAKIVDSRILTTRNVVGAMKGEDKILISTSAVGYYGSRGDQVLTEYSTPGADFLARLSVDWEEAALDAEKQGIRVAIMRVGVVLEVILAVGDGVEKHRIGAQPLAEPHAGARVVRDQAVGAFMHQDRQAKLASGDKGDRKEKRERVGPPGKQRHGAEDQRPGMDNEGDAFQRGFGLDRLDLIR